MVILVKEDSNYGNHGCLYFISETFDYEGLSEGLTASFLGNVACDDLQQYLDENPDIQVVHSLPEGVSVN